MGVTVKPLYDADFAEWAAHTAELLREGRRAEVDIEHLSEEIEDLGKNERSTVRSQLHRMLLHLVKATAQPERSGSSWRASIAKARGEIRYKLADSPSLRPLLELELEKIYGDAVRDAIYEMNLPPSWHGAIPRHCPYTLDELLEGSPEPRS
jgi:hypothetical protein